MTKIIEHYYGYIKKDARKHDSLWFFRIIRSWDQAVTRVWGGCNWLKNSSTCNIKFNQHLSIAKEHTQKSQTGITHTAFSEELPGEEMSLGLGVAATG